ncbi:MAG: hypothetical protein U0414_08615 [Polyangiaceae bacterium]
MEKFTHRNGSELITSVCGEDWMDAHVRASAVGGIRLEGIPGADHLVEITAVTKDGQGCVVVSQHAGTSLGSLTCNGTKNPFGPLEQLLLSEQALLGLGAYHEVGLFHGPFDPDQLLVVERDGGPHLRIADSLRGKAGQAPHLAALHEANDCAYALIAVASCFDTKVAQAALDLPNVVDDPKEVAAAIERGGGAFARVAARALRRYPVLRARDVAAAFRQAMGRAERGRSPWLAVAIAVALQGLVGVVGAGFAARACVADVPAVAVKGHLPTLRPLAPAPLPKTPQRVRTRIAGLRNPVALAVGVSGTVCAIDRPYSASPGDQASAAAEAEVIVCQSGDERSIPRVVGSHADGLAIVGGELFYNDTGAEPMTARRATISSTGDTVAYQAPAGASLRVHGGADRALAVVEGQRDEGPSLVDLVTTEVVFRAAPSDRIGAVTIAQDGAIAFFVCGPNGSRLVRRSSVDGIVEHRFPGLGGASGAVASCPTALATDRASTRVVTVVDEGVLLFQAGEQPRWLLRGIEAREVALRDDGSIVDLVVAGQPTPCLSDSTTCAAERGASTLLEIPLAPDAAWPVVVVPEGGVRVILDRGTTGPDGQVIEVRPTTGVTGCDDAPSTGDESR